MESQVCYPEQILILCDVPLTHTAENGYECDQADCICHWERRTEEYDASPHAWCDCESCQYVRSVLEQAEA